MSVGGRYFHPLWATVDAQGRSVVGGSARTTDNLNEVFFAARTLASGAVDTSFGAGGTALIDLGPFLQEEDRDAITVDAKGRIIFLGRRKLTDSSTSNVDTFAARLTESGVLDESFGSFGIVRGVAGDPLTASTILGSLAVATLGTSTFVYTHTGRSVGPADANIIGTHLDEAGAKLPYDFAIPVGDGASSRVIRATSAGGRLFVGNRRRVYALTAAGAIDTSFGTNGYVEKPHEFLSSLRDGSLIVARGLSFDILPPNGVGTSVTVTANQLATNHPLASIVERCDGSLVVAEGANQVAPQNSVIVLDAKGKTIPGHPRINFPSSSFQTEMQAAIDPRTGVVMYFGIGNVNDISWLNVVRVLP